MLHDVTQHRGRAVNHHKRVVRRRQRPNEIVVGLRCAVAAVAGPRRSDISILWRRRRGRFRCDPDRSGPSSNIAPSADNRLVLGNRRPDGVPTRDTRSPTTVSFFAVAAVTATLVLASGRVAESGLGVFCRAAINASAASDAALESNTSRRFRRELGRFVSLRDDTHTHTHTHRRLPIQSHVQRTRGKDERRK